MINNMPFATPTTSLFFEALDASNNTNTTVVYLFSKPVQCSDIQAAAWDGRITDGTQILELKMWGTTPAMDYTVTSSATPAPGEAAVSYSVSVNGGATNDFVGTGGKVRLETRVAQSKVTGSFMVTWATGSLNGTYNSTYCPGGTEP
jgi:hypothetical protein